MPGGPVGQGGHRVAGPGRAQLLQQRADGPCAVEADLADGVTGQQGSDRVAGPGLAQLPQQVGDVRRVVEAGVGGGVAGQQGGDRVAGPGLAQLPQQPGDGPRVVEADLAGGPVGGAGGVAWTHPPPIGDELVGSVGAPQRCRCCPEGGGVAVQAAVSCGLPKAGQVADAGGMGGEGVP